MVKYVFQRIGLMLLTMFIILSLTFILVKNLPKEPNIAQLLKNAEWAEIMANKYGEGQPIMVQLFKWWKGIITEWNWGISTQIQVGTGTFDVITQKLPATIKVNVVAAILSVPLGFLFGIIAALTKNKWPDHLLNVFVIIFVSVPGFVIMMLMIVISPVFGLPSQFAAADQLGIEHYIIPVLALSFGSVAGYTRSVRAELSEILSSDFLLLARTKGLTKTQATLRHGLRNAMVPFVPSVIGEIVGVLGGSLIVEQMYGIPGIGGLFFNALGAADYNLFMTILAFYTIIGLVAGLLGDLSYGFVDPRIRMGSRK